MKAITIGQISGLVRYPVKSMAGIEVDESMLSWHGLVGDRRVGVRQVAAAGDFPWLCASKLPELLLYQPSDFDPNSPELLPTRVRTPTGELLDIKGQALRDEIGNRVGCDVELMTLKHGIFDDAVVSIIATATVSHVCDEARIPVESRRFRANIEICCDRPSPFLEDDWVGRVVSFGERDDGPAVHITKRDVRCKMISLDPETAQHNPSVLQAAVRLNENHAGVYGTVIRPGIVKVGDPICLV